ncbi:hypothetical protein SAMN05444156_3147 [Verrucomicrobium sp. GAS474]|uniref:hypothetical protein n=1 Tax=Verrucomicrobium sp. GAS474 TaxID=1882831 RepID=UPI00087D47CD|nr:hypothetical protein [Verrucomicrobium sp. GAS474]SDU29836.1 hypothetical protein SAMN05444156_3147 [Verrucomicrobium sp. GAS474]
MRLTLPRIAFLLTALLFGLSLAHDAATLPETVASHFDAAGRADGFLPLRAHLISFGGLGFGMSLFLIATCYSIRLFPPSALNVPRADYWHQPGNHARACRFLFEHGFWIAAFNLLWLLLMHRELARANRLPVPHLAPGSLAALGWLYGAGLLAWIGTLAWFFWRGGKGEVKG